MSKGILWTNVPSLKACNLAPGTGLDAQAGGLNCFRPAAARDAASAAAAAAVAEEAGGGA